MDIIYVRRLVGEGGRNQGSRNQQLRSRRCDDIWLSSKRYRLILFEAKFLLSRLCTLFFYLFRSLLLTVPDGEDLTQVGRLLSVVSAR